MSDMQTAAPTFSGTPAKYRKITIVFPIVFNGLLYLGMIGVVYGILGQTWILGWKPAAIALAATAFYIRVAFPWIMGLDAQYGRGSGWKLDSRPIKLPERSQRPNID